MSAILFFCVCVSVLFATVCVCMHAHKRSDERGESHGNLERTDTLRRADYIVDSKVAGPGQRHAAPYDASVQHHFAEWASAPSVGAAAATAWVCAPDQNPTYPTYAAPIQPANSAHLAVTDAA